MSPSTGSPRPTSLARALLRSKLFIASAAASMLLATLWLASAWFTLQLPSPSGRTSLFLEAGRVALSRSAFDDPAAVPRIEFTGSPVLAPLPEWYRFGQSWGVAIPLWIALLPPAALLVIAIRRTRRANRPTACPSCGYDLTGLGRARPCPECGHARER